MPNLFISENNLENEKMDASGLEKIDSILIPDALRNQNGSNNFTEEPAQHNLARKSFLARNWPRILAIFGIFVLIFLVAILSTGYFAYRRALVLVSESKKFSEVLKSKDIVQIKDGFSKEKKALADFKYSFMFLKWAKVVPYLGNYIKDTDHAINAASAGLDAGQISIEAIEPYLDTLGFFNSNSDLKKDSDKTAQERVDFIVQTIPSLTAKMDEISTKANIVKTEIDQINPDRYPEKFKNFQVKKNIKDAQFFIDSITKFITNAKPVLESAPYLIGLDSPRTYLILFQNDKELRPTGGFMTGYAIMKVDKAKFEPVASNDMYNLDAQYTPSIQAPDPIVKYIKGPYVLSQKLRIRDMNWSPDFAQSMKMFTEAAINAGVGQIDGVIGVDTQLLVNFLDAIGPLGVPGYGNFSTEIDPQCNCPQVIHELEAYADIEGPIVWDPNTGKIVYSPPNSDNRKKIIGPLMNSILANALGQPKEKIPDLFNALFKSLVEKHVLFYFLDDKAEKAIADFGLGGIISQNYSQDYLHINDANLGGRKSNLYVTQEVFQDINVSGDGSVTKTLTITYKNPQKQDGWLNSILPNWVRVYVPKGSQLLASEGLEAKEEPYNDLGYTVFAGFFKLRPEGVSKITFKYKLPFKVKHDYKMLIQKQPGTSEPFYTINLGSHIEEFYLKTDKEINLSR